MGDTYSHRRCIAGSKLIDRFRPSPTHITANQYAKLYGLSYSNVRTMINSRRVNYARVGRWFFIDSNEKPPELLPAQVEAVRKARAVIEARQARVARLRAV